MKSKLPLLPLTIIISLICFFFLTKPAWNDYNKTKELLKENQLRVEKVRKVKSELDKKLADYDEVDINKKFLIKNSFPESLQEENFLKELSDAVSLSGVKLSDVKIALNKKQKKVSEEKTEVDIAIASMVLRGDYFEIKKIIYLLENMNRFARFNNFSIVKSAGLDDLSLKLDLSFFYKKNNLIFDFNNNHFANLLESELDKEFIDEYKDYRESVVNFSLIEVGEKGTANLFDFSANILDVNEETESVDE